ncbi:MAG: hypothetical protein ACHQ9S_16665 [Candidatus Binatia bacterium]
MWRKMALIGLTVCLLSRGVLAETKDNGGNYWGDAGWGVLAVVANVVYMPVKVVYAGLGMLTGSLAYVMTVGDSDTAQKVWSPSLGGSYVVTPAMLHGEETLLFNGRSYSND